MYISLADDHIVAMVGIHMLTGSPRNHSDRSASIWRKIEQKDASTPWRDRILYVDTIYQARENFVEGCASPGVAFRLFLKNESAIHLS